jgi:hypothetical protein
VIGRAPDGSALYPPQVVAALHRELSAIGLSVGDSATYPLHPSTMAYHHASCRPGRVLCLEVRRDLLAEPFAPFVQMHISPEKVARLAGPLSRALESFFSIAAS